MKFDHYPIVRRSNEAWFGFKAPVYEPTLAVELKNVPTRAWDPETKTWWFPMRWYPIVKALAESYFKDERWPTEEELIAVESAADFLVHLAKSIGYDITKDRRSPATYLAEWIAGQKAKSFVSKTSTGTHTGEF